jgi:hypothetical protein
MHYSNEQDAGTGFYQSRASPIIMDVSKHVRIIGVIYIVFGCLYALAGLVFLTGMTTLADLVEDDVAEAVLNFSGFTLGIILLILAALQIAAGVGLKKYENWARILTIIISVIGLFSFPIGTILGIYALWVLLRPETKVLFEGADTPTRY